MDPVTAPPPPTPPPPTPPAAPAPGATWVPRRAHRRLDGSMVGGVAAGLAEHLAVPVLAVRAFFVVTTALSGLGALLYAALWAMLPVAEATPGGPGVPGADEPAGLAAARRGGRREGAGLGRRLADAGPVLVLVALALGALLLLDAALGRGSVAWPLVLVGGGVALLWRQADEVQRQRWLALGGGAGAGAGADPVRSVVGAGGATAWLRLGAGAALVLTGYAVFALGAGSLDVAGDVAVAALLGVAGLAVVVGPWLLRLGRDLAAERAERVRSQERADVAAHLHDSVLQTLALIQRSAADPAAVVRLARAQERDLRTWLFDGAVPGGPEAGAPATVAAALRDAAARVELDHGVAVEVVTVGDRPLDEAAAAVVAAAREAVANAAEHSGADHVDVYAEAGPDRLEVFVRDRGRGFDPAAVPLDRLGLRGSVLERTRRHGGAAEVRSAPGEGTEVRLRLPAGTGTAPDPSLPQEAP